MSLWTTIGIIGSIIATIISILFGTYKIIEQALEKRDKKIDEALKTTYQFKEFKEYSSHSFMAFSKQFEKINDKLDIQNKSIAKLEGKLEELSNKK